MSDVRRRNNLIILFSIVAYVLVYFLLINRLLPDYSIIINSIFTIVIAAVSYFMYGFQSCQLNKIRKKVLLEVFIIIIGYFVIINILGALTGFINNEIIIKNTLFSILSVIALEVFRYIFINANKDSREIVSYITMAIILLDVVLNFYPVANTSAAIFVFISVTIIPVIFKNVVLSYLTYQVGYHSCLLYAVILCVYRFLVPSIPDLGNYLNAVLGVTLPSLIYIYASKMITNNLDGEINKKEIIKTLLLGLPLMIIFIILTCLVSFKFKYSLVGVNTDKLNSKIDKGDLILVKKLDYNEYKEGDIIIYKNEDKTIIDTIAKIESNNIYTINGKDENNEDIYKLIDKDMLLGKYNNKKISKLAYPTIWFSNLVKGNINY